MSCYFLPPCYIIFRFHNLYGKESSSMASVIFFFFQTRFANLEFRFQWKFDHFLFITITHNNLIPADSPLVFANSIDTIGHFRWCFLIGSSLLAKRATLFAIFFGRWQNSHWADIISTDWAIFVKVTVLTICTIASKLYQKSAWQAIFFTFHMAQWVGKKGSEARSKRSKFSSSTETVQKSIYFRKHFEFSIQNFSVIEPI